MSRKSISNLYPQEVTLNNCDREPIHLIGKIQSHGVLIAGNIDTKKIVGCSENAVILFNKTASQLLNTSITDLLSSSIIDQLFEGLTETNDNYITTEINEVNVEIIANLTKAEFILEFELLDKAIDHVGQQLKLTKMVSVISNTESFSDLIDQMTKMVKTHFGYDRVMLYEFDAQWNGSIIAEEREEGLESWLGLHYPSTDIPESTRRLFYFENSRMMKDVKDTPVNIQLDPSYPNKEGLDLSKSSLRGVSPVHIEYLSNMKVGATLTLSILFGDKVWGLITCHHYSAKSITYNDR